MWIRIGVGVLLAVNAWQDWRKREILPGLLLAGLLAGIAGNLLFPFRSWPDVCAGAAVGGGLLLLAAAGSGIGAGDGWLLLVTGIFLGFWENMILLLTALLFCAGFSMAVLFLKKAERKTEIPFVPFLLAAYIGGLFW